MRKLDIDKIFDCLCDIIMHELSVRDILRQWETDNNPSLPHILKFIYEERRSRNLPDIDIYTISEGLVYGWKKWNAGGGCMIWSVDFTDGKSAHLSDDLLVVSNTDTDHYWSFEDWEDQSKTRVLQKTIPTNCEVNWAYMLCPIFGQEEADLLHKDLVKLLSLF